MRNNQLIPLHDVVPRLASGDVETLLLHLMRHPGVYVVGAPAVKREHFSAEPHFGVLWDCYVRLVEQYGFGTVPEAAVHSAFGRAVANFSAVPEPLIDDVLRVPDGFLDHAFNKTKPEDFNENYGIDLLKQFLTERAVADGLRNAVRRTGDDVPSRIADLLTELQNQQTRIETLGTSACHSIVIDEFEDQHVEVFPTGVPFFDKHMGGGHGRGELNLAAAPYNGGKTALAVQLCVNAGFYFLSRAKHGEPLQSAYFFSYEEKPKEARRRVIACACDISKTELDYHIKKNAHMSTRGNLKQYEKERFLKRGIKDLSDMPGEWERYIGLRNSIDQNVFIYDMTGVKEENIGFGGAEEIAALLRKELLLGRLPGLVVIDYLNELVDKYCAARGLQLNQHLRHEIKRQIKVLIREVALEFNVPVWLMQQYAGDSQRRRPTMLMQLADMAECRSAAENSVFTMLFGKADPETHVMQMVVGKARRAGTEGKVSLVQLEGDFARLRDVDHEYTVDSAMGKIVSNAELQGLQAVAFDTSRPTAEVKKGDNPYKPGFGYKRGTGEMV